MTKIVINRCYGGFGLSAAAVERYKDRAGITDPNWWERTVARDDPILVGLVEEMGEDANSGYAKLKVVEVPDDVNWTVEEYDGVEWVAEVHRTWS